jgi:branched-chain amino acid aminotransferase
MDESFFIYNDHFFARGTPVISAGNRALRYGDGLFETMRLYDGRILNGDFHFERFFSGMKTLQFANTAIFSPELFIQKIKELTQKNGHGSHARVRVMAFRPGENIFDEEKDPPDLLMETWPLPPTIELNEKGLILDVFEEGAKSCDRFSNLKSNNYIISAMAGLVARRNTLDDILILNVYGRVCESAIANVFVVKDKQIFTPPLSEGCVAGVMRRWLLERFLPTDHIVKETELSIEDVLGADEIFLTNSIQPVRWVEHFREKTYGNAVSKQIFQQFLLQTGTTGNG